MNSPSNARLPTMLALCAALALAVLPTDAAAAESASASADPAARCFLAARDGGASYDCDLAVQVAGNPPDPAALTRALVNRALLLTREGSLEAALADLEGAAAGAPDDAQLLALVFGNRGNLLLRMGRPADALAAHGRAIELAPDDPTGYFNRAFAWRALGDDQQAQADVETAGQLLAGAAEGAAAPGVTAPSSSAAGGAPGR